MFISIVGTRCSGKSTVEDYLISKHGFIPLRLSSDAEPPPEETSHTVDWHESFTNDLFSDDGSEDVHQSPITPAHVARRKHDSFLFLSSPVISKAWPAKSPHEEVERIQPMTFYDAASMLHYVTCNWRQNFVTMDLHRKDDLEEFAIRPFFMLLCVDAPVLERYARLTSTRLGLEDFVRKDDHLMFGEPPNAIKSSVHSSAPWTSLHDISGLVHLKIVNSFHSIPELHAHLQSLDLLNPDRLRPEWDTYFMRLASLASLRSNCMKRRVGAIVVRNNRVVSTGYNGTARGLKNCSEGGCARCNSGGPSGQALNECVCLHAEENALLEAGRERVGDGAVLYCNTCPCLGCTVKIIQTGIKEVVYNLSYKVDDASLALFNEAGVHLRRHAPPPYDD